MNDKNLEVKLERDSVCAGDDCDAPHTQILFFKESMPILEVASSILKTNYLPRIIGGTATWVMTGKDDCPIAVLGCV